MVPCAVIITVNGGFEERPIPFQEAGAVAIRKPDVREHQIEVILRQIAFRLGQIRRADHGVALLSEHIFKALPDDQVIIDYQDFFNAIRLKSASTIKKPRFDVNGRAKDYWSRKRRQSYASDIAPFSSLLCLAVHF